MHSRMHFSHCNLFLSENKLLLWQKRNRLREFLFASSRQSRSEKRDSMAFDGVAIANVVSEMKSCLLGGRIYKIAQTESDELMITVKTPNGQKKLFCSASASLPLIYLTQSSKQAPMTAPGFCMLLRKHLQNGRITDISQPGLERIVFLDIEHLDEMGDLKKKRLIIEIMGKHSNIIFCNEEGVILDSIKHISGLVSSVREVLPGRPYFIPHTQDKLDGLHTGQEEFLAALTGRPMPVYKAIYTSYTGISPILAQEMCYRAGIDADLPCQAVTQPLFLSLYRVFDAMMQSIQKEAFAPCIAYVNGKPAEFAAFPLTLYHGAANSLVSYASISELLEAYYAEKNVLTRIRQKSSDLRRIVQTALERNVKKYDLQLSQMKDTEKRDTYRVYGELLNTYGYQAVPGATCLEALNYYTNEPVTIPLDPLLSAKDNAKRYFDKYNKMKRTYEALSELTKTVKEEIDHLESISTSLDIALAEEDLVQIRQELEESGYVHRKGGKKVKVTSRPFHYISSDGFSIYVGKNNYQNEELTFRFANGNDWWFHAKGVPGSHVILKNDKQLPIPDRTFEEAGRLAAYYSKRRGQDKAEVDYIQKKAVKKPGGAKPGFVIYHTNYSLVIDSDISGIRQVTGER